MTERPSLESIAGLRWERNWRLPNGGQSYVVPFASVRPFNVVFHGNQPFAYGHYGIHLGQQDSLTFLGSSTQVIDAQFLDCRRGSPTERARLAISFVPSSEWRLSIPPGIAHTFSGLENVTTINDYSIYLPDPAKWLSGDIDWDIDSDIINIDRNADPALVALYAPNTHLASDTFYRLLADKQLDAMPNLTHAHPYTVETRAADGSVVQVKIQERLQPSAHEVTEGSFDGIAGLRWQSLPYVHTGPDSGITPFAGQRPYYIVDHGEADYSHDAFGIHLGQDDHLTFLGSDDRRIKAEFADCRQGSPTLHMTAQVEFSPSATRALVIPRGVAHRFEGLEQIYTLNQGTMFLDDNGTYEPGNDVTDWPAMARPFPEFPVNGQAADEGFYADVAKAQAALKQTGYAGQTPVVIVAHDGSGKPVRVALRAAVPR